MGGGFLAGRRPALCKILTILQQDGLVLGLYVNLEKCEVFCRAGFNLFPDQMKKSDKPNLDILGSQIEDLKICTAYICIAAKHTEARHLLERLKVIGPSFCTDPPNLHLCVGVV